MTTCAILRRSFLAIACNGVCVLFVGIAMGRLAVAFEGQESTPSTGWASEASQLVEKLSEMKRAYSQATPPTSFADLAENREAYRDWPYSSQGIGSVARHEPDRTLWELWLLTGMPPLADEPTETMPQYLQRNVAAYEEYIAKHAALSDEAVHRIGLSNAVRAMGSPLWYMTLKYLAKRASLQGDRLIDIHTTPSSVLIRSPRNETEYAQMSAALSRWMKANENEMVWDARRGMFRPLGGEYRDTEELFETICNPIWRKNGVRRSR